MGAGRIVVACVTLRHVFPQLPEDLRSRVVSLIDLIVEQVLAEPRSRLLLVTTGTRVARIFERHPRWDLAGKWVRGLAGSDQAELHEWIYRLKANHPIGPCVEWLSGLACRYGGPGLIFGCTERPGRPCFRRG